MKNHDVIVRPLVTEKSMAATEDRNVITFEVNPHANKIQVKKAVEVLFNVKVSEVRLMNIRGKMKRLGRNVGKRRDWRKAYVKLAPGQKAPEFFEGV